MKKKLACGASVLFIAALLLSGCSGTTESSQEKTESSETATLEISETSEIPEGEGLNAVFYNDTCYYGTLFYGDASTLPEDAKLLGTATDSSSDQAIALNQTVPIPTEELETNCAEPGTEIYAEFQENGSVTSFYIVHDTNSVYALKDLTTEAPSYYTDSES